MKYTFLLLILILSSHSLYSQARGSIKGVVTDTAGSKPLAGVSVKLEGTPWGAYTGKNGTFEIKNVPLRKYKALVSLIGYHTLLLDVEPSDSLMKIALAEQPFRTGELVVSANKRVQSIQETPVSVAVFDSRAITERAITRMDRLLQYIPGVEVNKDNVIIRGSEGFAFGIGARSQLLLDGFPLVAGDNGDLKLDALTVYMIERVEVVKGTGSALYGTGALGGVINVITREPSVVSTTRARASIGLYTHPRFDGWQFRDDYSLIKSIDAGYSNRVGKFGFTATAGANGDDGWKKFGKSYRNNLYGKVKYYASDRMELSVTSSYATERRDDWIYWKGLDSATFPPENTDISAQILTSRLALFGDLKYILDDKRFVLLRFGKFATTFDDTRKSGDPDKRQTIANSINAEALYTSRVIENLIITGGLNGLFNTVSAKIYGNRSQSIFSAYAQGEYTLLKNLTLTAGGRIDNEYLGSSAGEAEAGNSMQFSPKLGAIYSITPEWTIRANAGGGFRAPTVAERYVSTGFAGFKVKRNPGLKPELSQSYEIGGAWRGVMWLFPAELDFSAFRYDMQDLIEPMFIQKTDSIQFRNLTKARIMGIEFSLTTLLFNDFTLHSSLTYLDPKDVTTDQTLKYRSEVLWYSTVGYKMDPFEIQFDYRFKSRVKSIDLYLNSVKDYDARVNARIFDARAIFYGKRYGLPFAVSLNAYNLFDYYYTEMIGNLAATRSVVLQLEWNP